ncbi:MAG: FAD-dependent oxidoreductase, partial [Acidobacteriota bacterium]|nr:FAD-dependent oxidoreductase [Acidobacteriota bacterium]
GDELDRFEGEGRVAKVITKGGRELDAELVVIGAGVAPDVRLASGAGLQIGARGGVRTDERLQTSAAGIFAAGDICEYSSPMHGGDLRVEHWDVAFNHGRVAALNMSGQEVPYDVVPYFFSDLADWVSLEYVGPAFQWDGEIVRGSHEEGAFTTWFVGEGRVRGALAVGRSEDLDHARRLIASGAVLDEVALAALSDTGSDLSALGA